MHLNLVWRKAVCSVFVFIFLTSLVIPSLAFDSEYVWSVYDSVVSTSSETTDSSELEKGNFLNLESGSAILIEQNSGKVLYEHNIHEKLKPASVTKVMTLLLIMESLDSGKFALTDSVPCSEAASKMGGSQIWLDTRETLTVDEMLKAICIVSANDCTVAMAEYIAGSEDAFVSMMNSRAKELGMNDTTFKNCHGIDEDGHVTSAYDISIMSRELLINHPLITKYTTIWMDSLRDGQSELVSTNKLIRNYKGATGLKTGSTSLALYNLSASATRDDLSLIAVVMKAPSSKIRFSEAQKLLDFGFNNFSYKSFGNIGDVVKSVTVNKGSVSTVDAVLKNSSGALVKKGMENSVVQNVSIEEEISAPIVKGQKLGEITYTLNDEVIGTTEIISNAEIKKLSFGNIFSRVFGNWLNLLR